MNSLNKITDNLNEIITLLDEWGDRIKKNQQERIMNQRDIKIEKILKGEL